MKKEDVGSIIRVLRTKKNISQEDLCAGVCSAQMISKIENNERLPDKFLLDILLQRLGKSPDKFETILSEDEYVILCRRQEIENAIMNGEYARARSQLDNYRNAFEKDSKLHRQYYYKIMAVIKKEDHDDRVCIEYLIRSVEQTFPDWRDKKSKDYLLGVEEILLLLMLGQAYIENGEAEKAKKILERMLEYLKNGYTDEEELVKVYPPCAYFMAIILENNSKLEESIYLCEKAVNMLVENGVVYWLAELMEIWIRGLVSRQSEPEARKLKKQRESLLMLYEEYGYLSQKMRGNLLLNNIQREFHLAKEFIRTERMANEITQEELIEDIYSSPESLSRVENGKASPSRQKFEALLDKLGMDRSKYNSYVSADEFELYEKIRKMNFLMFRHEYERANVLLEELKLELNEGVALNKQYILSSEASINWKLGKITDEQALELSKNALENTYIHFEKGIYRVPLKQEATILNQIAVINKKNGGRRQAVQLLEQVVKSYGNSELDIRYHYSSLSLIMINLSSYLEEEGEIKQAIFICDSGIELALKCGRGNVTSVFLTNKACALEKENEEEKLEKKEKACKKYFRQAFYLSDLMKNNIDRDVIKKYYENNYEKNIVWY